MKTQTNNAQGEKLEVWSAGDGDSYVYTDNWKIVQALGRKFGQGAQYIRNGVILAWQFKIPRRFVDLIQHTFRRLRKSEIDEGVLNEELSRGLEG
jgi:hypothetical protein